MKIRALGYIAAIGLTGIFAIGTLTSIHSQVSRIFQDGSPAQVRTIDTLIAPTFEQTITASPTSIPTPKPAPTPRNEYVMRLEQLYGVANPAGDRLPYFERASELEQIINQDPSVKEELAYDYLMMKTDGFVRGVYVVGWQPDSYTQIDLDGLLDKIKNEYHANTVIFLTTAYSEGTVINAGTPTQDALAFAVTKAREHGLIPGIRLQIDPTPLESANLPQGYWRNGIGLGFTPEQWNEWFVSLKQIGMEYVNFAHKFNVAYIGMFDEMTTAQQQPQFSVVLKELETAFDGVMVYQPNLDAINDPGLFVQGVNAYIPARSQREAIYWEDTRRYDQSIALDTYAVSGFSQAPNLFSTLVGQVFNGQRPAFMTEVGSNDLNSAYPYGCDASVVSKVPHFIDEQANYLQTSMIAFSYLASKGRVNGFFVWTEVGDISAPCAEDFRITPSSGKAIAAFFDDPFSYGAEYWPRIEAAGIVP